MPRRDDDMAAAVDMTATSEVTPMEEGAGANEVDYSSVASAHALVSPSEQEFDLITRRVKDLMEEGRGECIFDVGVGCDGDDGLEEAEFSASKATLESVAATLNAQCVPLRETFADDAKQKKTAQFLVSSKKLLKLRRFLFFIPPSPVFRSAGGASRRTLWRSG